MIREYWGFPVFGIDPSLGITMISSTWQGLWGGSIGVNLQGILGLPSPNWWSGSNPDGSVSPGATCSEWHASDTTTGTYGSVSFTTSQWIYNPPSPATDCANQYFVLCLGY